MNSDEGPKSPGPLLPLIENSMDQLKSIHKNHNIAWDNKTLSFIANTCSPIISSNCHIFKIETCGL